ncbi:MAG: hypothetical protein R3B49_03500 [Phycisphaerales bacterium]
MTSNASPTAAGSRRRSRGTPAADDRRPSTPRWTYATVLAIEQVLSAVVMPRTAPTLLPGVSSSMTIAAMPRPGFGDPTLDRPGDPRVDR